MTKTNGRRRVAVGLWLGMAAACSDDPQPSSEDTATPTSSTTAVAEPSASASAPAPFRPPALRNLDGQPATMDQQRADLIDTLRDHHAIGDETTELLQTIFSRNGRIGQGDPKASEHPMTKRECQARRAEAGLADDVGDARCGSPYMVPVYDPDAGQSAETATLCVDQYEFPNVPCEYPVTWVSAYDAAAICRSMGKRMCDAHEWEGACAGRLRPAEEEYHFGVPRATGKERHNGDRPIVWAYGPDKDHGKCASDSTKTEGCMAGKTCGTNTYPAGAFATCRSPFGVFDLHGNAAEHMNLPMAPDQFMSKGGSGETEMKGSWFIFKKHEPHKDDCRWRAPSWHRGKIDEIGNHMNYHLGFRCCRDL